MLMVFGGCLLFHQPQYTWVLLGTMYFTTQITERVARLSSLHPRAAYNHNLPPSLCLRGNVTLRGIHEIYNRHAAQPAVARTWSKGLNPLYTQGSMLG